MTTGRAQTIAGTAGAVGLLGVALAARTFPGAFAHAWLAALSTWLLWPLGCMGLLLVHALTGGRWGDALRPQLVAGMMTLVLLPLALVPWLLDLPALYPWLRPEVAAQLRNHWYLNGPFLAARGTFYLLVWFGLAATLVRTLRQAAPEPRLARIAPAGLVLLAVTLTFATIDATMSLDPTFASSAYGLVELAEAGLVALAVSLLAAARAPPPDTVRTLGRLLLALALLWAYLDFMQLLIIWQSDRPTEAAWYGPRVHGGWGLAAALIAIGHTALPFMALVWAPVQRSLRAIRLVAVLLVLSEIVRGWWLVVPAAGRGVGPVDLFAMLAVIGTAAALALRLQPLGLHAARVPHG